MLPMPYRVPAALDFPLFSLYGENFPAYRGFMLLVSAGMLLATWLLLKKTRIGLIIQAALTHPSMVSALGHDVPLVFTIVFAGGSLLAGLAGVIAGNYLTTESGMADAMGPIVFVVVIFGGLGSLAGCFIASILMGMVQTFSVVIDWSHRRSAPAARHHARRRQPARRDPHHPGLAHRPAGAVCAADPDPAVPAARPDGDARDMSDAAEPEVRVLPARPAAARDPLVAVARRAAVSVALPWLFYDWQQARHVRLHGVDAEPDRHDDHLRPVVQHADGPGRAAVVLPFGAVRARRLFDRAFPECRRRRRTAGADGADAVARRVCRGLGFAIVFGYMATKQRSTAFAMITLGIVQLVTTAATMFHHFFGGEGGVKTDRVIGNSLFGLEYGQSIQVYYLIVAWMMIAAVGMYFHTMTPLGRMANACRDNHERAQFVGYDPRIVRFLQFALSGFYAGIGGGLFAITYEIVTFDAVAAPLAANALLMAYIGGCDDVLRPGARRDPDHAAAERRQPDVEFLAGLCRRAVHRHGDLRADRPHRHRLEHAPIARAGLLRRLVLPYLRILVPGLILCCSASSGWWNCCRSSRSARRRASVSCCSARRSTFTARRPG